MYGSTTLALGIQKNIIDTVNFFKKRGVVSTTTDIKQSRRRADNNCEEASPEEMFCGIEPQLLPLPDLLHHLHFGAPEPQSSRYIGF
jgi:hypothetical protein